MRYEVTVNSKQYTIEINQEGQVTLNGEAVAVDFARTANNSLYSLLVNNRSFEALVEKRDGRWEVLMQGYLYHVEVLDERSQLMRARSDSLEPDTGEITIKAPMPGLVVSIPVEVGQAVAKGDNVIILESMKMENELKAPREGRIERINVRPGDSVEGGQALMVIG